MYGDRTLQTSGSELTTEYANDCYKVVHLKFVFC